MSQQRLLTSSEIFEFLSRHPLIDLKVEATKLAMALIGYDQLNTPPAWYEFDLDIGLIGPSGIAVDDEKYGTVVIQPAPNGNIYFSGWTTVRPNIINLPPYESPPNPNPEPPCDWLCTLDKYKNAALLIVGSLLAIEIFKTVRSK